MTGDTPEAAAWRAAARVAAALPGEIYAGLEPAFNAFVEELAGALLTFRRAALEEASDVATRQAKTYRIQRGRYAYQASACNQIARAIRALAGSTKEGE